MEQKDYFQEFEMLLQQTKDLGEQVKKMQDNISTVLVENAELKIENENLRNKLETDEAEIEKGDVSKAHLNLEKLYNQGYHICTPLYGSHRSTNEECAFCLGIIYGHENH